MKGNTRRKFKTSPFYGFSITWLLLALALPLYRLWALIFTALVSGLVFYLLGKAAGKKAVNSSASRQKNTNKSSETIQKKSYGPDIDPIVEEGNRALKEMGRLYMSIKDSDVRMKINEIMRITDKITQDAIEDPSDIPQIKKFMNYYLPTTIKLLNAYDRMSSQGIEGENLDKSMKSINDMLDSAIEAYKKRLDSLFENQALDIETEIKVMNTILAREGLTSSKDFEL